MHSTGPGQPYRAYVDESPVGVFVADATGAFVDANPTACELVGYDREELLSLSIADVSSQLDGPELPSSFTEMGQTGRARGEHALLHADGRQVDVLLDTTSLGEDRFVAYVQDISEQKGYERDLERFKTFVELSSDIVTVLGADGRVKYNSPAIETILGYEQDELNGQDPVEYIHPDDRERVSDQLHTLLSTEGVSPRAEYRVRDVAGEWVWIESYGTNRLDDPHVEGVVLNLRDVTERKERERTLTQYGRAVEQAMDLLAAVDTRHRLLFANERYRDFHDVAAADVGEVTLQEVLGPEEYAEIAPRLDAVLRGETHEYEMFRTDRVGEQHAFDIRYSPLRSAYGDVVGIVATMRDVTERNEQRRRLKQYEYAVESTTDWIVAVDTEHRLLFANDGFRAFYGFDGDVRGTPLSAVLDDVVLDDIVPEMERAFAGERVEFEHRTVANGVRKPVRTTVFPLRDDDDEILGIVASIRDTSELKTRERQLRVLDRVLRHNLNNKMNVVSGYADVIRQRSTDPFVCESVEKIRANSEQLTRMASKERDITKLLSDPPPKDVHDLVAVVERIASSVQGDHPEATIETDLPARSAEVVAGALGRALEELLMNAVVHSDRSRPAIGVRVRLRDETVELRIRDDGPGIPEQERAILTGEAEIEPLHHGSGLGLWLVKLIAGRADAVLQFDDNEPRGSVVTVRFPRAAETETETETEVETE
ncbi:PAS domain S-box protein [Halobellus sp. Atlit-31R]|nr:PAS domain S-box protein [Halobellus sp. Atlit-31R]